MTRDGGGALAAFSHATRAARRGASASRRNRFFERRGLCFPRASSARATDRMASLGGGVGARMRRALAFARIERNARQICASSARATAASPTLSARPTTA
ncbi:hypothetical protein A8H31_17495 [Burkholderia thailandensis]|nr:hypothetical protein A8H31_17495 [Burkholderia thailandensis]AWY67803.1 hypothetical protein A8H36_22545 [Burkholderia thailandensis]KVG22152.1 hypothetical protein WJ28_23695 [Burkholderia thailandensis]PNE69273.1 hypothetical protein A8H38_25275 [Burkholderia thailandensis]